MELKSECPWLYRLAYEQINSHLLYNTKVNEDFLFHVQIIEYYLGISKLEVFPKSLESICEASWKLIEKQEIVKILENR